MQADRRRRLIGWAALPLGLATLGSGLLLTEVAQWRLQLLLGLWLLSLLPRALLQRGPAALGAGLTRLTLGLCLAFLAVGLQLTREQLSQAAATRTRAAALLRPAPAQAPDLADGLRPAERTSLGNGLVWPVEYTSERGAIVDRNGTLLATDRAGQRIYHQPATGQVLGFASRLYGTSGVEASFDDYLSGVQTFSPTQLLEARLLGTPLRVPTTTLQLTLDTHLQAVAQQALGERRGAVVLLDPRSGALLAAVGYPRYDPNRLTLPPNASQADLAQVQAAWQALVDDPASPLLNRATQGRYPPGSVIKTLTAAAALDSGVLRGPEDRVTCPNRLMTEAGAPPVRNAVENLARRTGDPSDLRRVFAWSCNTAFAQLGLALGSQRLIDYAARFGLRLADTLSTTADLRDLPADTGSIAGDAAFLERQAALADTAYGQGQALVTPLDMAQMVAVIANDGAVMRPYLVERVQAAGQTIYQAQPTVLRQAVTPTTAAQMRAVMQSSVEIGYANPVALPGVTIGAKTGTAETPSGAPHAWFVALAPVEQPRFAIAVIVENGGEGSSAALPVARAVLAAALGL